jgi:type-F conjugative transfer system pilin assembly protein TrbC
MLEAFWSFWDVLQKIGLSKQKCYSVLQSIDGHIDSTPCSLNTPILKVMFSPVGVNAILSAMMLGCVVSIVWYIQPWNRKYFLYGLFLIGLGVSENTASSDSKVNISAQKIARMKTSKKYDEAARRLYETADQKAKEYSVQAKGIGGQPSQETISEAQKAISTTTAHSRGACKGKCPSIKSIPDSEPSLQVCMSFSVPIQVWKELNGDLMRHQGVFVVRGLPNNSFQAFAGKVLEFRKQGITAPIRIDPKLFDRFNINQVPVFVVKQKDEMHTVSGTLTIPYVMNILHIKQEGNQ